MRRVRRKNRKMIIIVCFELFWGMQFLIYYDRGKTMSFFAFKKNLLTTSAIFGLAFMWHSGFAKPPTIEPGETPPMPGFSVAVSDWENLLNEVNSGTETNITLTGNIIADTADSLIPNRDINISGNGSNKFTISAADGLGFDDALIQIESDKTLSLSNVGISSFISVIDYGGAIRNNGTLDISGSKFTGNSSFDKGGAIFNNGSSLSITDSTFTGNSTGGDGGAINNFGSITSNITGSTFTGNIAESEGGAISNSRNLTIGTLSATFKNNTANYGGAIFNSGTINLVADAADSTDGLLDEVLFKGNVATSGQGAAIYNTGDLTFTGNNNGAFAFYDDIYSDGGTMTFDGDGTGTFYMLNDIKGTGNITFDSDYTFNMLNDTINVIQAGNLTINSVINMAVDVDLANATMDHFEATNVAFGENGKIIVNGMKLLSDMADGTTETEINFINPTENVSTPLESAILEAETLMNKYKVKYDETTGNFVFNRYEGKSSDSIAGDLGQNMVTPGIQLLNNSLSAQVLNRNMGVEKDENQGLSSGDTTRPTTWAKAFGSKDSVELKNSYNSIDTQFYGVVGGVDSRTFIYDNGVNAVYGIYAAYMGSNQKQNSVKVTQDGGYLGVSADFTKSGIFSRFTAHGGYIANEAKTAWGNDKFDIWTASVSNKTGYEIDFGEYTLKPALYASYMYINTENYTSKAGAKLKNHTKNVFEVTPEVKLAKDFGAGLEGYAKVAYTWNFYQGGKVTADDVLLPKMSVKPYVEYGVGLEKDWSEEEWNPKDITSYAEINRHDGGRTGWDINAGLKFQF